MLRLETLMVGMLTLRLEVGMLTLGVLMLRLVVLMVTVVKPEGVVRVTLGMETEGVDYGGC